MLQQHISISQSGAEAFARGGPRQQQQLRVPSLVPSLAFSRIRRQSYRRLIASCDEDKLELALRSNACHAFLTHVGQTIRRRVRGRRFL
ncbi:hypothetical protein L596_012113 [Steinernema carpocapsae]|uniref:Uncharacterized protein n=1 Tax=Steinernema carpocapsae TaxID=34508 RepID=A0A4U5NWG0_STECR|nr:hypothetical protein L596_012113 [Steinernema carpocapsae]